MRYLLAFIPFVLAGCLEMGGEVTIGSVSADSPAAAKMSLSKIQSQTKESWKTDTDGKIYLNTPTISIEGTCSRGVGLIEVEINGTADATKASCGAAGTFNWTKFFPSSTPALGNEYVLVFQALLSNGTKIDGLTATKTIVLDTRAPSSPTLDAVPNCKLKNAAWACDHGTITVTGSWSGTEGVVSLDYPTGGTLTYPTSTSFQFVFTIAEGESKVLNFTVKDFVGNISGTSTAAIGYYSMTDLLAGSVSGGGTYGFSGGPINSAPSMIGSLESTAGIIYDSNSTDPAKASLKMGPIPVGAQWINP